MKTGSRFFLPSRTHYVEHVLLYLELATIAELYHKRDAITPFADHLGEKDIHFREE